MDIHASIPEKVKLNKVNRFIELPVTLMSNTFSIKFCMVF